MTVSSLYGLLRDFYGKVLKLYSKATLKGKEKFMFRERGAQVRGLCSEFT